MYAEAPCPSVVHSFACYMNATLKEPMIIVELAWFAQLLVVYEVLLLASAFAPLIFAVGALGRYIARVCARSI